ncbi:helix-turn-helix domain-containing protein [Roseovarius sp.]|uniref:winged helix-turn-helix domain-containing protein n=1 Tax=Roseovarius sp. TaxID=1486281 RepID=UPI0035650534
MNEQRSARRVVFSHDFSSAKNSKGSEITFTRSEADILRVLSQRPGITVTRDRLLDAISGEGSDRSDRNIDYLVSCIRKKLADDPKNPQYIMTRYGEGYRWLGNAAPEPVKDAHVEIGPLRGLEAIGGRAAFARRFAEAFHTAVKNELPEGKTAVFAPEPGVPSRAREQTISLTFILDGEDLDCVFTVRAPSSGLVLALDRRSLTQGDVRQNTIDAAQALLSKTWRSVVTSTADSPLPVAMHEAAGLPVGLNGSWRQNDVLLRRLIRDDPDDPEGKLFYATHLHSKYVQLGLDLFHKGEETCRADEDEIERLVLSALPHLSEPTHRIMAAKLLFFLDRGYQETAVDMAEAALKESRQIASALVIAGQIRSFAGWPKEGLTCIEQAVALADYGSEFHVYAMFMKCQTLTGAGEWVGLATARSELYRARPSTMLFDPILTDPNKPSFRARGMMMALPRKRVWSQLKFLDYIYVRLFRDPAMRANSIRAFLRLAIRRFGADVVPGELHCRIPEVVEELALKN